jgi:cell division protein FtsW
MTGTSGFSWPVRLPRWPSHDPFLLVLTFVMPLSGVVLVASARIPSVLTGDSLFDSATVFQMIWAIVGVILALALSAVNYHWYARFAPFALAPVIIALVMVLLVEPSGERHTNRWLDIGQLTVQPSEVAKLVMIVTIAALAQRFGTNIYLWQFSIGRLGALLAAIVLLVLVEPDLGTAITMLIVGFAMIMTAGARLRHIASVVPMIGAIGTVSLLANEYQRERLGAFVSRLLGGDPDTLNTGYQALQAQIAMGTGGITGRGFGQGTQKFRVSIPSSDDIFAVIGEEFGLVGTGLVLVIFLALFVRGIQIAASSEDVFGRLLAVGIVTQIVLQAFVNMAVVTGLIPATGIPLPFISRGGSSMLASLALMGILMNVARHAQLQRQT